VTRKKTVPSGSDIVLFGRSVPMLESTVLPPSSTLKMEAAQYTSTHVPFKLASFPDRQNKYEYPDPQNNCHK
jgi:hypothetical protein